MKKILALALVLAMVFTLAACGGASSSQSSSKTEGATSPAAGSKEATATDKPLKVLLISGLEGDKSFADSAIIGARKAEAVFNIELS